MRIFRSSILFFVYILGLSLLSFNAQHASAAFFKQINTSGFENLHTTGGLERKTMAVYQNKLFVGVTNRNDGAVVMSFDGKQWQQVNENGFGSPANTAIASMVATDKKLYAGTTNKNGGEIWEYDGSTWRCLHKGPFEKLLSFSILSLGYYKDRLYAGIWDQINRQPAEVWAYDATGVWQLANKPGFGDVRNNVANSFVVANIDGKEKLYTGVWKDFQYAGKDSGGEIWSFDGEIWEKKNTGLEGFGELNKGRPGMEPLALCFFNRKIYAGLWSFVKGQKWELWSFDGKQWIDVSKTITSSIPACYGMAVFKDKLYVITANAYGKFELWSYDEHNWVKIIGPGSAMSDNLGSPDNKLINALAQYDGKLYLGVTNDHTGYKIFQSVFPEISPRLTTAAAGTIDLFTLTEGALPDSWRSSDPAVALIDEKSGIFKALAPGLCTITAHDRQSFEIAAQKIEITQGTPTQKKEILISARCSPASAINDGASKILITATVYLPDKADAIQSARLEKSSLTAAAQQLYDDGTHGDDRTGDNTYSFQLTIPAGTKPETYEIPISIESKVGSRQTKAVCTIRQGHTTPKITYLTTKGSSYHIPVLFALNDPDGDEDNVTFEYQRGDDPWRPASIYSQSGKLSSAANAEKKQNMLAKLSTKRDLNHYVCVWESEKDIGQGSGLYRLRAIPSDTKSAGQAVISTQIKVNNQAAPADDMVLLPSGKFYIDKYEYPNHFGYYPLVGLNWREACAECRKQEKELCTGEQWVEAYYGKTKLPYPYGTESRVKDRDYCNTYGSMDYTAVPSGLYENCVNDLGISDMGGNVYEWVTKSEREQNIYFMADQSYILNSHDVQLLSQEGSDHRHEFLGFRCCKKAQKRRIIPTAGK